MELMHTAVSRKMVSKTSLTSRCTRNAVSSSLQFFLEKEKILRCFASSGGTMKTTAPTGMEVNTSAGEKEISQEDSQESC